MFINRKSELSLLEERFKSNRAEFIVVYGRRRVGKTALLLEFLQRSGGIYLLARETSEAENLRRFSQRIAEHFGDEFLMKNPFRSWDAFFEYLHQRVGKRLAVVIDEFPYLVKGNPSLPSILQEYWDLKLSKGRIFLVVCGSSIGMMERLLGYKSPIYGRRTAQLKVSPLGFFEARAFLPGYSPEGFVKAYGILGGTPAYLLEFDDSKSIEENLLDYFRPDSFLYGDARFVLMEELEEPRNYFAVMEAIARGKTTLGGIMNETGLERGTAAKYLSVLIDLGFVRREIPVTASRKSRKGRYYISDPYFAFWFRYVHPNADLIETGQGDILVELAMEDFNEYLGWVFEEIAKEYLIRLNGGGRLPFRFTKIGRWWHRGEEIDLLALNEWEKKALLVEVKWRDLSERDARRVLKELESKSKLVRFDGKFRFGLIARSVEGKEELREEGYLVWDLKDFESLISPDAVG